MGSDAHEWCTVYGIVGRSCMRVQGGCSGYDFALEKCVHCASYLTPNSHHPTQPNPIQTKSTTLQQQSSLAGMRIQSHIYTVNRSSPVLIHAAVIVHTIPAQLCHAVTRGHPQVDRGAGGDVKTPGGWVLGTWVQGTGV